MEKTVMLVRELMTKVVATCNTTDTVNRAARLMWENDCGCIPVVDASQQPIAVITDRDICMASYTQGKSFFEIPVAAAMSSKIHTVRESDPLRVAEAVMRRSQVRRLPVVGVDGRITGILSLNDIVTRGKHALGGDESFSTDSDEEVGSEAVAKTLTAISAHPPIHHAAE